VEQPWVDTHVHLDQYGEPERAAIFDRAREAGVEMIAVAVDMPSSRKVLALEGMNGVVVGVHPKNCTSGSGAELRELAANSRVIAIGECGFDDAGPPGELQAVAFRAQCQLAHELNRTLVLHIDGEDAWATFQEQAIPLDGLRVVRHYFTGDEAQANWHRERGHFLSFGNPLWRESRLRDIARSYPEEGLLIETDSYPLSGRNTEPAHVRKVGETLALVRDWTFAQAREKLAANTCRAFNLPANYFSNGLLIP